MSADSLLMKGELLMSDEVVLMSQSPRPLSVFEQAMRMHMHLLTVLLTTNDGLMTDELVHERLIDVRRGMQLLGN